MPSAQMPTTISALSENRKAVAFGYVVELYKLHSKAQIRFVAAISLHGFVVRHARKILPGQC